jgi:hypothetical protein
MTRQSNEPCGARYLAGARADGLYNSQQLEHVAALAELHHSQLLQLRALVLVIATNAHVSDFKRQAHISLCLSRTSAASGATAARCSALATCATSGVRNSERRPSRASCTARSVQFWRSGSLELAAHSPFRNATYSQPHPLDHRAGPRAIDLQVQQIRHGHQWSTERRRCRSPPREHRAIVVVDARGEDLPRRCSRLHPQQRDFDAFARDFGANLPSCMALLNRTIRPSLTPNVAAKMLL